MLLIIWGSWQATVSKPFSLVLKRVISLTKYFLKYLKFDCMGFSG